MRPSLRISIRLMLMVVLACCLAAWLGRGWASNPRVDSRAYEVIAGCLAKPIDIDRDGRDDRDRVKALDPRGGRARSITI